MSPFTRRRAQEIDQDTIEAQRVRMDSQRRLAEARAMYRDAEGAIERLEARKRMNGFGDDYELALIPKRAS